MQNFNHKEIESLHLALKNHQMYSKIKNFEQLKIFMETHIFAVWDFMSLLKRLQNDLTCTSIPWKPKNVSKQTTRLINEIVLGEESDLGPSGEPIDHFTLYLRSMDEVGASYINLINFLENYDYQYLTPTQKEFVEFNLNLAKFGKSHEVAAAFFFGREKLIPDMFTSLLSDLKNNLHGHDKSFSNLIYYLERHIEIDGGEHSHKALECLTDLCGNDETKWQEAFLSGIKSLQNRISLWNEVEAKL